MEALIFSGLSLGFMYTLDKASQYIYRAVRGPQVVPHNARWFFVHAVCNFVIAGAATPDLILVLTNPDMAFVCGDALSVYILYFSLLLHVYHSVVFFEKLTSTDILHHSLMCGISGPLAIAYSSRLSTAALWFLTGLPGAVDYTLLWLVKLGRVTRATERRAYLLLSMWIRSPGCIVCAYIGAGTLLTLRLDALVANVINVCLTVWNGQYFMMLTCRDFGRRTIPAAKLESRMPGPSPVPPRRVEVQLLQR